ncbi:cell division protein ZipA [Onishia niordana]|uniref:cell division protein ZipA n=1 Tax=Onishia niordana TaxID=2508711 RepID=UPI0010A09751|nr:cell division protein ZipA [Halomonas niordiana]
MELREWLIILGLALVTIIVIDGVRRLQRQRRVPRLDQVDASSTDAASGSDTDPEQEARDAEVRSELPNGGARVVKPAAYEVRSKPKLQRQEHPGPSRVLAKWREENQSDEARSRAETPSRQADLDTAAPSTTRAASAPAFESPAGAERSSERSFEHSFERSFEHGQEPHGAPHAETRQAPSDERPPMTRPAQVDEQAEDEAVTSARADKALADKESAHANLEAESQDARHDDTLSYDDALSGLAADPADHEGYHDDERYRIVDFDGVSDSLRERSAKVGGSVQRLGSSLQQKMASRKEQRKKDKLERERQKAERKAREASRQQQEKAEREAEARRASDAQSDAGDPLFSSPSAPQTRHGAHSSEARPGDAQEYARYEETYAPEYAEETTASMDNGDPMDPTIEQALRTSVKVDHPRETLGNAEEIVVISVMSRDEDGFSGTALLDLMLVCGLRYCRDMQIFHRFETQDPHSELQFSMVNVIKPGTFPIADGDDFTTPGISFLMPLPGAHDGSAAFEAMVETAMVVVRHLGGELKDENHSVMTAQTVGFARERVQEFDRRHRLHRTQAN